MWKGTANWVETDKKWEDILGSNWVLSIFKQMNTNISPHDASSDVPSSFTVTTGIYLKSQFHWGKV